MNPEVKSKWIAALRSGEFPQTRQALKTTTGYCCLGVLCEVAVAAGKCEPASDSPSGYFHYNGRESFPPPYVTKWAGVTDLDCDRVALMNDKGYSFLAIANHIEENL